MEKVIIHNPVESLKAAGCKVKVRHVRRLKIGLYNPEIGCVDHFLTRGEFIRLNDDPTRKFGNVVDPRGGFCEVTVEEAGVLRRGKFNVAGTKPYNRKVAVYAALGRAMK